MIDSTESRRCVDIFSSVKPAIDCRKFFLVACFSVRIVGDNNALWTKVSKHRKGCNGGRDDVDMFIEGIGELS